MSKLESVDQLETRIARLHHELASAKRAHAYWYEKNRLLENAIRNANHRYVSATDRSKALTIIARRVPITARKKFSLRWPTLTSRPRR